MKEILIYEFDNDNMTSTKRHVAFLSSIKVFITVIDASLAIGLGQLERDARVTRMKHETLASDPRSITYPRNLMKKHILPSQFIP